jgi:hypothetical protein
VPGTLGIRGVGRKFDLISLRLSYWPQGLMNNALVFFSAVPARGDRLGPSVFPSISSFNTVLTVSFWLEQLLATSWNQGNDELK